MTIIDPMHNLFLGSAKYFTQKILIGKGILDKCALDIIHRRLKNTQVPLDMGRLPSRIDTGSTFTAEQWMHWTIHFSVYCLHGLLNNDQIECWRHFVLACRKLCKQCVTEEDIKVADLLLLLQFCKRDYLAMNLPHPICICTVIWLLVWTSPLMAYLETNQQIIVPLSYSLLSVL